MMDLTLALTLNRFNNNDYILLCKQMEWEKNHSQLELSWVEEEKK